MSEPTASAILVPPSRRGAAWIWVVPKCPLCGGRHVHGAGPTREGAGELLGHRCAHCIASSSLAGYVLVETPEHTPDQQEEAA